MEVETVLESCWACEPEELVGHPFYVGCSGVRGRQLPRGVRKALAGLVASGSPAQTPQRSGPALARQQRPATLPCTAPRAQRLTLAVRRGDVEAAHRLLEAGAGLRPERPLPASLNPLVIEAACCGQRDVLELVLERDASAVSAVDVAHGATPLHWAALRGDWGAAHLLLAKRADVLVGGWRAAHERGRAHCATLVTGDHIGPPLWSPGHPSSTASLPTAPHQTTPERNQCLVCQKGARVSYYVRPLPRPGRRARAGRG